MLKVYFQYIPFPLIKNQSHRLSINFSVLKNQTNQGRLKIFLIFILLNTRVGIKMGFPFRYHNGVLIEKSANTYGISVSILGRKSMFETKIRLPICVVIG